MTCVTSLNCPSSPTMTFGDNTTRSCTKQCSNDEWGDPTSRYCVAQCPNASDTGTTHYYGDDSTGQSICVQICPQLPRKFGENGTNLCVEECPIPTYGEQTGSRLCVAQCPLIGGTQYWFAQNTSRICVKVCQTNTWGLKSSRECVEDAFDCGSLWADNSTFLCVSVCPASVGTFGDPTTKICTPVCPDGYYADDYTRECVAGCPSNNGQHDTFANNQTNICEEKCTEQNAYGDPQTAKRYCVTECSQSPEESFADPSSKLCVPECPSHPDLYAESQNHTCISSCPSPYYANTHTRRCESSCEAGEFKLNTSRVCVTECPSDPDLFADSSTGFCESTCSSGYKYSVTRTCVPSCAAEGLLEYNGKCVKFCPDTYYANSTGNCLAQCPSATFGQNTTTTCEGTCITGYAHDKLCLAICPDGKYGQNHICEDSCTGGRTASNVSNLCVSTCDAGTYMQNGVCQTSCSSGYADPNTHLCSSSCTAGRFGDPTTDTCVETCPSGYFQDSSGFCKDDCSPKRADAISGTCTNQCSDGLWGYNYECIDECPDDFYGYESTRDCSDVPNRPATTVYGDDVTQTWVTQCPYEPLTFADPVSKLCVEECESSYFADPESRKCETSCTNSYYYADSLNKKCVLVCPEGYQSNPDTGTCQQNCTNSRYDYKPTRQCVTSCPKPYYGYLNSTQRVCVLDCPSNTFAEGDKCESGCTSPLYADSTLNRCVSDCVDSFASDDSRACQTSCSQYGTIADNSTNKCVAICPTQPDYYEQNDVCVMHCSSGFADPQTGVRECTSLCTEGRFGDPVSGRCLTECLPGYYAQNDTNLCVEECPDGFADNSTGKCVADCPAPTFADSLNNKCMKICSGNQFGEGRVCVSECTDPLYGNPLTRTCDASCSSFDYLFAQNTTNMCVKDCSFVSNSYADRNKNMCMDECSLAEEYALAGQGICTSLCPDGLFMENSTKKCQGDCDTGYAEPTSRYCVQKCFGNPQTFAYIPDKVCVYRCLNDSVTMYADNTTFQCVSQCPSPYFSDPISGNCVLFCPEGLYSEIDDRTCTANCPYGYADNKTRSCVAQCPQDEETFGDPHSKECVKVCPDGMVAEDDDQICVDNDDCPTNTWSDIISKHCVSRCPSQPLYFGYNATTSCVQQCPSSPQLYGDYVSQTCITACTAVDGELRFADPISRTCVYVCPILNDLFGDTDTGKCTDTCSNGQLRDNSTQRCVDTCPSDPDYYADNDNEICVRVCPDGLFASDATDRQCIADCTPYLTFADPTTNRCSPVCPQPYFADNSTYKCVLDCPSSENYFADPHSRTCVKNCPSDPDWITFAQDIDRTCVTRCPTDHYAQNSSGTCVDQCPTNQYADTTIQRCVADCTVRPGEYKQTNDRVCVSQCPITPTKAHKYEVNHTCVEMTGAVSGCPGAYYANPLNDMCTTLCPYGYFAETSTKMCVEACSESSEYADPYDRKCKTSCTSNPESFAYDGVTRTCVKYCPEPYFSENQTWTCTTSCPSSPSTYFKLQTIRSCVLDCPPPYYAYSADQQCVLDCPDGLYAQDSTRTCEATCLLNADNSTNKCVKICPQDPNYFAHNHVCVLDCPDNYYRDISTRQCVPTCPVVPLLFADNSTNTCVEECPVSQNYFADNITKKCVLHCFSNSSVTTFADASTRSCVLDCPPAEDTYADPISGVCQPACTDASYYKSSLTHECVTHCPDIPVLTYAQQNGKVCVEVCQNGKFGNNDTLTCDDDCSGATDGYADSNSNLCVSTCPVYFFAYDDDSQCVRDCPDGLFADSSTRKCVPECPGTERLYADSSTNQCVSQCPTGSYGDSQDWICKDTCPVDTSGYRLDVARQCVDQCPEPYFAFVSSRICVNNCGNGLYGDPITRECKDCPSECPTCLSEDQCLTCDSGLYLSYGACVSECILNDQLANYANNAKMLCVEATKCPSNTFASNSSKSCQSSCPVQMYGNSTTRTCQDCPSTCLGCINSTHCTSCIPDAEYSEVDQYCYGHCNSTHRYKIEGQCYASCIDGTYLDYTAVNCEACNQVCKTCEGSSLNCTSCDNTFLYEGTCVNECPQGFFGKDNICAKCTGTQCDDPLNFEIISTVEDYRETIVVKFNKKTNIKGDPKKFMKIKFKIKNKRLLQDDIDYQTLFNEGVQFEAEVMADGTIKIYPMPGMSLLNFQYQVVFTDSSYIVTEDGSTLQDLEGTVEVEEADVYPSDSTTETPFITVGFVLSIIMLACTFFMLIFGLSPFFVAIEAFQIFSLYAYCPQIAPNLFYFLKELRFTRFAFMPNIFYSIYVQPSQYDSSIPQKVLDTEGQLSFAVNSMGFMLFLFLYLFYAFVVFILTSKINNNRPLKNLFIRIWNTRIKFGIVNDFLWLFSINTLVGMFVQFKYTANGGDLALAILFGLAFIAMLFGFFGYAVRKYREDPQSIEDNFSEWKEGSKNGNIHRFFIFLYYLRKILFSIFLVALISEPMPQAAILLTIFAIYLILIPVIRPYKDNLRNFVHFAHEGGLTFINGGIIFFIKMVEIQQPVGSKIINGEIIAIIVTIHLCIALIWGIFRSYIYLKQLRDQFKKTEFYKLYLDEEYDQSIEKQISELNQQEKGEVQSVEIANTEAQDQEQQIIRLKIKRKVKKDKKKGLVEQVKEMKNISKNKGEFIKIDQSNQKYYEIKANKNKEAQEQFEKMVIDHDEQINMNIPRQEHKERHDNEWVMMEEYKNKQEDAPKDKENQIEEISEGKSELLLEESKIKQHSLKQDIKQKGKEEDPRFRRSYADFDERNYFSQEKEQKQGIRDNEESREFEDKQKQENVPQKDKKRESIYDAFDFDGILQEDEQQPKIQEKDEGKNPKWDIQMEDLLQEDKNDDEEIKKKKEKSKKIHMSLFDDEDFD